MKKFTSKYFHELLVFTKQPTAEMTETYEHKTDIVLATDGTESRTALRSKPRATYDFKFSEDSNEAQGLYNVFHDKLRDKYAVPVWTQSLKLKENTPEDSTELIFDGKDALYVDWALIDLDVMIYGMAILYESEDNFEVVEVGFRPEWDDWNEYTVVALDIGTKTKKSWPSGTVVMPLRPCYISDKVMQSRSGLTNAYTLTFQVLNNAVLDEDTPETVEGTDVYLTQYLSSENAVRAIDFDSEIDSFDPLLGRFYKRTTWLNNRVGSSMRVVTTDLKEYYDARKRFQRHRGKFRPFWYPSFEDNLKIIEVNNDKIEAIDDGMSDKYKYLYVMRVSTGEPSSFAIISVVRKPDGTMTITLDRTVDIDVNDIQYVSYITYCRMDTDNLSLSWVGNGVSVSNWRIVELAPSTKKLLT